MRGEIRDTEEQYNGSEGLQRLEIVCDVWLQVFSRAITQRLEGQSLHAHRVSD